MIDFSKKKVAVLGFGIEGQDVCQFLIDRGAQITVFDQKTAKELDEYRKFKNGGVKFNLGEDYLQFGLLGFDIVFRSPAFKLSMPEIVKAKKKGTLITSATNLFFNLCPGKIIGVTGTKGKGTTATLTYKILKEAGRKVFLAGNIGQPMLSLLPKLDKSSLVVLELSSFQLQDLGKSPHIAVVLFITSEHLDYHRDTKEYVEAKANIVRHQQKNDFAVFNADDPTSKSLAGMTVGQTFFFSRRKKVNGAYVQKGKIFLNKEPVGLTNELQLRGEHNWDNVCAAITASHLAGAKMSVIKKTVFSFKGLEHRLELVDEKEGVRFYNDSFSTVPETAIAAVQAFEEPIILIAGGSEKGSDFTPLGKAIAKGSVKTLILIGDMANRIRTAVEEADYKGEIIDVSGGMKEIVGLAFKKAKKGDVVLLSPACASFDMFKNYKDRGHQFKEHAQAF